jgi:DNA segregation ATPase FtsK/SpoIIIE-like protein
MKVLGHAYKIPRSTVALAGGMEKLLELFASRTRGYFRDQGTPCEIITSRRDIEVRLELDGEARVFAFGEKDTTAQADHQCIFLVATEAWPWSPLHDAFAALVSDWPEITGRNVIHQPSSAAHSFTEEQLAEARAWIIADNRASTSYVQRRLAIGYNKAAAIIERLEQDGVISAPAHDGKRQVLVSS